MDAAEREAGLPKRGTLNCFLTSQRDSLHMTRDDLEQVWGWANDKLATGEQPPWVWDQYLKLCETLDALLAGMAANRSLEPPQPMRSRGTHLRLVSDGGLAVTTARRSHED